MNKCMPCDSELMTWTRDARQSLWLEGDGDIVGGDGLVRVCVRAAGGGGS